MHRSRASSALLTASRRVAAPHLGIAAAVLLATMAGPASGMDTALPMETFLDRLMQAESGGRADAKNLRSSAYGPFQFIESTFLYVARRHFPDDVAGLSDEKLLALRADPEFARRAAQAYTNENAAHLVEQGLEATSVNLRLAFLVGAAGAVRLLRADAAAPLSTLFASEVLSANPFMANLTVADLVRRAALDVSDAKPVAGLATPSARPGIVVRCKLGLASCRRWLALQQRKLARISTRRTASH